MVNENEIKNNVVLDTEENNRLKITDEKSEPESHFTEEDLRLAKQERNKMRKMANLTMIQKGTILNPKGRPKTSELDKEFYKANLASLSVKTFERFHEIMDKKSADPKIMDMQIKIGKEVLARKFGNVNQNLVVETNKRTSIGIDLSTMSEEQKLSFIAMAGMVLSTPNEPVSVNNIDDNEISDQ